MESKRRSCGSWPLTQISRLRENGPLTGARTWPRALIAARPTVLYSAWPWRSREYSRHSSLATHHFCFVNILILDVALGVGVDARFVDAGKGALDFAGMADDQAARRDFGAFEEERAGGYDAAGADVHAVQDYGTHADEAARLDGAAVQRDGVADGHVVAEDERVLVAHDVEDAAVLNVGARADANVVHVAANHGAGPDARIFADDYVADDDGGGVNVGRGGDLRVLAAVGADVGLAAQL